MCSADLSGRYETVQPAREFDSSPMWRSGLYCFRCAYTVRFPACPRTTAKMACLTIWRRLSQLVDMKGLVFLQVYTVLPRILLHAGKQKLPETVLVTKPACRYSVGYSVVPVSQEILSLGNSVASTHIRMRGPIYACASYDPATVFPRNMRRCQEKLSLERRHAQTINCSEPAKWSRANTATYIRTFERENCQAICPRI